MQYEYDADHDPEKAAVYQSGVIWMYCVASNSLLEERVGDSGNVVVWISSCCKRIVWEHEGWLTLRLVDKSAIDVLDLATGDC